MIFGFGKKNKEEEDYDDEQDLVMFQGAFSGAEVDFTEHARLVQVGLLRAKELITEGLERRAERIRIEPKGERAVVQLIVDGVGYAGGRLSSKEGMAVTQVLKLVSGLDVKNRKSVQKGGIRAEWDDRKFLVMLESKPLQGGAERLTIDLIDVKNAKYSPQELEFSPAVMEKIRELTSKPGIVIAAGPPGSGTTTTSWAILRGIDSYVFASFCFVDPGHRELGNVSKFDRRSDATLDAELVRLTRMEGNVAYIEPLNDAETLNTAMEHTGRLSIVSEMTARDAPSAVESLCKLSGDPAKVASALKGVFGQKLIRKLCEKCKQPYRPNPKLVQKVGLPEKTQVLYKPPSAEDGADIRVCKRCGGSGYLGRVAMLELIEMTDKMKEVVAAGKGSAEIKQVAREENMLNFKDEGLRLVAEGVTSLEELQRAFRAS
ncbi:MAG: Flp pilus assembly complex ATPase component TadA [Planctomycetaceae bacterium]|nr:Flp pilus assembly complex ATPase component TadA [Planctomycetaceae bacterium]